MASRTNPDLLSDHRALVARYLRGIVISFASVAGTIIAERLPAECAHEPMRPCLTLWSCAACGGRLEDALPVAGALDLFDRFLVLHDELVDETVPTVARWGLGQSLNAGDALYALAFRTLAADVVAAPGRLVAAKLIARAVLRAIEAGSDAKGMGRLRRSAALTGAALQAGAVVAGAPDYVARSFGRAGRFVGLAAAIDDRPLSERLVRKATAALKDHVSPDELAAFRDAAAFVARRAG